MAVAGGLLPHGKDTELNYGTIALFLSSCAYLNSALASRAVAFILSLRAVRYEEGKMASVKLICGVVPIEQFEWTISR